MMGMNPPMLAKLQTVRHLRLRVKRGGYVKEQRYILVTYAKYTIAISTNIAEKQTTCTACKILLNMIHNSRFGVIIT